MQRTQLLDMRAMMQQLHADKTEAEAALAAARCRNEQQEDDLRLLRAAAQAAPAKTAADARVKMIAAEMSDAVGESVAPLEAALLDLELTISAAKSEATPSRAGLAASDALKEERYLSGQLRQQVEALLAQVCILSDGIRTACSYCRL
jgi:hypothetical protein